MIDFEQRPPQPLSPVPRDAGAGDAGEAGGDAGGTGDAATPITDAGTTDASITREPPPAVSLLAFIEDPDEALPRLRLVDARAALLDETRQDDRSWRFTLFPPDPALDALDFAWSPDGQRIALRYDTSAGPRIAVFAGPDWRNLGIADFGGPTTNLTATANYQWSPDGTALALELTNEAGAFMTVAQVSDSSVTSLAPVAFDAAFESMAWTSSQRLLVVRANEVGRILVSLTLEQGALVLQRVETSPLLVPLELRATAAGVLGVSRVEFSQAYFWQSATVPVESAVHSSLAYLSSTPAFVAEPIPLPATEIYPIANTDVLLDTLSDCSVVLTWVDGADPASLAGSKIACLGLDDGSARITIHRYDGAARRSSQALEDETLLTDFALPANWEAHGQVFSPSGEWLALTSETHDFLIDLRVTPPTYRVETFEPGAATARSFSRDGKFMLRQRGRALSWWDLAPTETASPIVYDQALPPAFSDPVRCTTSRHVLDWCGSPNGADPVQGRWHPADNVSVSLTTQGLTVASTTEMRDGFRSRNVSSCGAGCVRQFAFPPRAAP